MQPVWIDGIDDIFIDAKGTAHCLKRSGGEVIDERMSPHTLLALAAKAWRVAMAWQAEQEAKSGSGGTAAPGESGGGGEDG